MAYDPDCIFTLDGLTTYVYYDEHGRYLVDGEDDQVVAILGARPSPVDANTEYLCEWYSGLRMWIGNECLVDEDDGVFNEHVEAYLQAVFAAKSPLPSSSPSPEPICLDIEEPSAPASPAPPPICPSQRNKAPRKQGGGKNLKKIGRRGRTTTTEPGIYNVEAVLGMRYATASKKTGDMQFFIKWEDYDLSYCTWEPIANMRRPSGHLIQPVKQYLAKSRRGVYGHPIASTQAEIDDRMRVFAM